MRYEPESPPPTPENPVLATYLAQELRRVAEAFLGVEEILLPELNVVPDKPRDGLIVLADGTNFDPGYGAGFYGRRNGVWSSLNGLPVFRVNPGDSLQAAIDAAELVAPAIVMMSAGVILVSAPIVMDVANVALIGAGPYQTTIQGDFAAGDVLHLDGSAATRRRMYLSNFRVTSSVAKTSGAGVHLEMIGSSILDNIIAGGQIDAGNLWHGFHFDGVDFVSLNGFEAKAQQDGVRVNGGNGSVRADLYLNNGKIGACDIGLHVTGDFGGLQVLQTGIIANATNVDIDQDDVAIKNREVLFGPGCAIDSSTVGPNIRIEDPNLGVVRFSGAWVASAKTHGIHIINSGAAGDVNLGDTFLFKNIADGIRIDDPDCRVVIGGGTTVEQNGGWGINATVAAEKVKVNPGVIYRANTSGDVTWQTIRPRVGQTIRISIADDKVYSFTPQNDGGDSSGLLFVQEAPGSALHGQARFQAAAAGASINTVDSHANVVFTTGVLTGTTGVDGDLTIAVHTDKKVYVENRRGGTRPDILITLMAAGASDAPSGETIT